MSLPAARIAAKSATAERSDAKQLEKRVINGTLVAALGLASVFFKATFGMLVLAIAIIGVIEYGRIAKRAGTEIYLPVTLAAAIAYQALAYFHLLAPYESVLVAAIIIAAMLAALVCDADGFVRHAAATVFGALYLGKLLSYCIVIRTGPNGVALTLWIITIVACTDIVGMMAGLRFGKSPLAPRISPKKTREGAAGAFLTAVTVGTAISLLPEIGALWWAGMLCAAVISLAAIAGDLIESALKRSANVKDSGHLIAGHGGVLDRFDSYILSGAVAFVALHLAGLL